MSEPSTPRRENRNPRDAGFWARGRSILRVSDVPEVFAALSASAPSGAAAHEYEIAVLLLKTLSWMGG